MFLFSIIAAWTTPEFVILRFRAQAGHDRKISAMRLKAWGSSFLLERGKELKAELRCVDNIQPVSTLFITITSSVCSGRMQIPQGWAGALFVAIALVPKYSRHETVLS